MKSADNCKNEFIITWSRRLDVYSKLVKRERASLVNCITTTVLYQGNMRCYQVQIVESGTCGDLVVNCITSGECLCHFSKTASVAHER